MYSVWIELVRASGRYRDAWVDEDELRGSAVEVFRLLLMRIARQTVSEHLSAVSARVGERRADQVVSLAEVQAAANLDFRVVWEAMAEEADESEAAAMLEGAPTIWAVVDAHTQGITEAYRRRIDEVDRLSDDRRREWFDKLLKCKGERADVVMRAAEVLELDIEGRFRVVIASRAQASSLRGARDTLAALRWTVHYQEAEAGDLLVVQCTVDSERRLMNCLNDFRCSIAPAAHGLEEVPSAMIIAADILRALPDDWTRPGELDDAWLDVAASQSPQVVHALSQRIVRRLQGHQEAGILIDTARAYCAGDGTITKAAAELFCHRNTVLNRLEKLRDLTGYDVRKPRDAAAFLFALTALGGGKARPTASVR